MATRYNTSSIVSVSDYLYMNEDQIDPELKCIICQQPFVNPSVGNQCGHTFCDICVSNWYKQNSSCPTCRQTTSFRPLTTRVVLSQLDRLLVRCQQCNQNNIQRGNFADHIQHRCRQTILKCEAADISCQWTGNREQHAQHSAICPLLQIRPVVEELKAEISALGYQLQMFMDEVRDQPDKNSRKKNGENNPEKERVNQLNNDLRHTWTENCRYRYRCNFCQNYSQKFFTCLVCLCSAARDHISAHDFNGSKDDVICRPCVQKYRGRIYFFENN